MNLTIKTDKRLYLNNNFTFCHFTHFCVNFFLVILFGKKNTMKLYLQRETKYITFFNGDKTLKMSIKKMATYTVVLIVIVVLVFFYEIRIESIRLFYCCKRM